MVTWKHSGSADRIWGEVLSDPAYSASIGSYCDHVLEEGDVISDCYGRFEQGNYGLGLLDL